MVSMSIAAVAAALAGCGNRGMTVAAKDEGYSAFMRTHPEEEKNDAILRFYTAQESQPGRGGGEHPTKLFKQLERIRDSIVDGIQLQAD